MKHITYNNKCVYGRFEYKIRYKEGSIPAHNILGILFIIKTCGYIFCIYFDGNELGRDYSGWFVSWKWKQ